MLPRIIQYSTHCIIVLWIVFFTRNRLSTIRCQFILVPNRLDSNNFLNQFILLSSQPAENRIRTNITIGLDQNLSDVLLRKSIEFTEGIKKVQFDEDAISTVVPNSDGSEKTSKIKKRIANSRKLFVKSDLLANGQTKDFNLNENILIYFQTDKPIYRSTETVRFRLLLTDANLMPIESNCNLTIKNHQKVKLDFAKLSLTKPYYFADYSFDLPLITKTGIWNADVLCGRAVKDDLRFEVREYTVPVMKVDIETPSYLLYTSQSLSIRLNATYFYGKPVNDGHLRIDLKENLFSRNIISPKLIFLEAIITDLSTETKEKIKSKNIKLVQSPFKISLRFLNRFYKTKLANYIAIEITDVDDKPVENVPLDVEITSKSEIDIKPYQVNGNDDIFRTDEHGLVILTFRIDTVLEDLKMKIKTIDPNYSDSEQTSKETSLNYFDEKDLILISNQRKIFYTADELFFSSIVTYGDISDENLFYILISKGHILEMSKIVDKQINFYITNRMAPYVRILVLGLTGNQTLVADSFRIQVVQKQCGVDVEIKDKILPPGANLLLKLRGQLNDIVALNAVDQSVSALTGKQSSMVSKQKFLQYLERNDFGLDRIGGKNSLEIIKNAGFQIFGVEDQRSLNHRKKRIKRNHSSYSESEILGFCSRQHFCCWLALHQPQHKSCQQGRSLIASYSKRTKNECERIYFECCLCRQRGRSIFMASSPMAYAKNKQKEPQSPDESKAIINGLTQDYDDEFVRYDFRDSWLFDLVKLEENEQEISVPTPHSITRWSISSLSISPKNGLCFHPDHRLTIYKPFFIHLSVPQYIVLYEKAEVLATIFNYLPEDLNLHLFFYYVEGICSEADKILEKISINMKVKANSSATKAFPIIPIQVGVFTIKLMASSHYYRRSMSDVILKNITVVFPGVVKEQSQSFDLDPTNRAKRETRVHNNYTSTSQVTSVIDPENLYQKIDIFLNKSDDKIIPGTMRHKLSFIGQKFNPTIKSMEELENLITKPKGCGEQNMYYMAFNLYTLMYLDKIGKLNHTIQSRATIYLQRAYRQQMNFRKDDGSFSAFMNRPSSIWLTAFISKVFCQSANYMKNFETGVIIDAIKWLQKQQNQNGSWTEIYPILHSRALGGVDQDDQTLTAYILIALNQCDNFFNSKQDERYQKMNLNDTIQQTVAYLIRHQMNRMDLEQNSYSLALSTYALLFQHNRRQLRSLIDQLMHHSDLYRDLQNNYLFYDNSHSTETTSYALLALTQARLEKSDLASNLSNWLLLQDKDGTFDNTQDTIIALEALSFYHMALTSKLRMMEYKLVSNVSFNSRPKRSIEFNEDNIDLLHSMEVDANTNDINIVTIGNGFGKVELLTIYNVYEPSSICSFDLEVTLKASQKSVVQNSNFDANVFFDESSQQAVMKELKIPQYESIDFVNPINVCDSKTHLVRTKRAFWATILQRIRLNQRKATSIDDQEQHNAKPLMQNDQPSTSAQSSSSFPPSTSPSSSSSSSLSSSIDEDDECQATLSKLPNLGQENLNIKIMSICLRRMNDDKGMVILEVSLISGYKVAKEDLENLKKNVSFIEFYEIVGSKVIFYFMSIPHARRICLCFRIYQQHIVEDIQSALVKVYDYYKSGSSCSRLYTDVRMPKSLDYVCKNESCRCVINKRCPSKIIKEINKLTVSDITKAFGFFKKKICSHSFAVVAKITEQEIQKKFHLISLSVEKIIRQNGDVYSKIRLKRIIKIRLHPECSVFDKGNELFLIYDFNQLMPLIDGESILHLYDFHRSVINEFLEMLENDNCS